MRIQCPACAAEYEVPEDRLAPGRVVRCVRCSADWAPVPPVLLLPPPALAVPEPVAPSPPKLLSPPEILPPETLPPARRVLAVPAISSLPPPEPPVRRAGAGLVLAWFLSFAVLGTAAWLAYDRRAAVMQAWPASERAYALIGLAPA